MAECRGCIERGREPRCWVEHENFVCFDCAFSTPEDRQRQTLELQAAADRMRKTLRDEYAQAALQGLLASSDDPAAHKTVLLYVNLAFIYADEALKQRQGE
jgi:hypothetical protein